MKVLKDDLQLQVPFTARLLFQLAFLDRAHPNATYPTTQHPNVGDRF